jgi:hypothetical protein
VPRSNAQKEANDRRTVSDREVWSAIRYLDPESDHRESEVAITITVSALVCIVSVVSFASNLARKRQSSIGPPGGSTPRLPPGLNGWWRVTGTCFRFVPTQRVMPQFALFVPLVAVRGALAHSARPY